MRTSGEFGERVLATQSIYLPTAREAVGGTVHVAAPYLMRDQLPLVKARSAAVYTSFGDRDLALPAPLYQSQSSAYARDSPRTRAGDLPWQSYCGQAAAPWPPETQVRPERRRLAPQTAKLLAEPEMADIRHLMRRGDPGDVFLKIYDITEGKAYRYMNYLAGFHVDGIWHTAVLSHGKERFYCDGPLIMSSDSVERKFALHLTDIVYLGKTQLAAADLDRIMLKLRDKFGPAQYNIITCNCNHFTEAFMQKMRSRELRKFGSSSMIHELPAFIKDQPKLFMSTVRGRGLVWLVENILERTDNFLNTKFAQGIDAIIQKFR